MSQWPTPTSSMTDVFTGSAGSPLPTVPGPHSVRTHGRRDLVFSPGTAVDEIYLVQEGKIRLFMMDPSGRQFTLNVLTPGDIFVGHTRCYGEAISEVKVAVMNRKAFLEMVQQQPEICGRLVPMLGHCLREAFDIIEGLVFKACSSRLAWMLLSEAEARGERCEAGVAVEIDLVTEQIATRIGATRQTTSTLINAWERSGLIARRKGKWVIKNMERLRQISVCGNDENE